MKSIKKGYSLAELSMVVVLVSMIAFLIVPVEKNNQVSDAAKAGVVQSK